MHHLVRGTRSSAVASLALGLVVSACAVPDAASTDDRAPEDSSAADLVDVRNLDLGADGWDDHRTAQLYLDGDSEAEFVTVASRRQERRPVSGGTPGADTRLWTVVVGEPGGAQTVAYSQVVPQGHIEVVVAEGDEGETCLLILERTPTALLSYRVHYAGPGDVRVERLGEWPLDPNANWYGTAPPPMQVAAVGR